MPQWPSAAPSGGTTVPDPTSPHQRMTVTTQDSQHLTETRPVISPRTTASVTAVVRSGVFGPVSGEQNRGPELFQGLNRAAHR